MKKALAVLLTILIVMSCTAVSYAEIIEYEMNAGKGNKFDKSFYVSDKEYKDASIHVVITYDRANSTDYMIVYISVANATQIRTFMENEKGTEKASGVTMAKHANAVFAIDSDSFTTHEKKNGKHIVRQGRCLKSSAKGLYDVLIIDSEGNLSVLLKAMEEDIAAFEGEIVNCFSFGPALIVDGELMPVERNDQLATEKAAQRVALCQLAEVEEGYNISYACVITAGPENPGSVGMNLHQFAQLVYDIGGITVAYNFDGGSGAIGVFNGKKMNRFGMDKSRDITDIIYFATADTEAFQ